MSWDEVCHWIAQGAVNISYVGKDNPVYRAMNAFCEYVQNGRVAYSPSGPLRLACPHCVHCEHCKNAHPVDSTEGR